jgi:hypothetical protein
MKRADLIVDELGLNSVDLVRMDTEGFEQNIYGGLKTTIKKFKPLLLIEIHPYLMGVKRTTDLLRQFRRDGYECKYYISRSVDVAKLGIERYIEDVRIEYLLHRLSKDALPKVFTLLLHFEKANKNAE